MTSKKKKRDAALAKRARFLKQVELEGLEAQRRGREESTRMSVLGDMWDTYHNAVRSGAFSGSFSEFRAWAKEQSDQEGV